MSFTLLFLFFALCRSEGVSDVSERLSRLEYEMQTLHEELAKVVTENESLKNKISDVQAVNNDCSWNLSELKSEDELLKAKMKKLEKKNTVQNTKFTNLEKKVMFMRMHDNFQTPNGTVHSKRAAYSFVNPVNVAFHATINGHIGLNDNEMIRFDNVFTNLESAYDGSIGLFQCPTPGYYVFYVNLLVFSQKRLEAQIVRNGASIQHVYAGTSDNGMGPGSNTVIVLLKQGDRVWVKVHDRFHDTGDTLDGSWCSFGGFLLYPAE